MKVVKAKEMQEMDRKTIESYGIPGVVLMENAGLGATKYLLKEVKDIKQKKVTVIAGSGNNGGDGFVIARYLINRGIPVKVYLLAPKDKVKGDAKFNLDLLSPIGVDVIEILNASDLNRHRGAILHSDLIVDAIFGTGLNADVRGHYKDVIDFINRSGKEVFSVDMPSGLNSDTGQICGVCVEANLTATFGFAKSGHFIYPGATLTGKLNVVEIGIPNFIVDNVNPAIRVIKKKRIGIILKNRDKEAHKGTTGHLLVIGGSKGKTGAPVMTSKAAGRSGAGLITTMVPESLTDFVDTSFIEGMTAGLPEKDGFIDGYDKTIDKFFEGKRCVAIGPGLGASKESTRLVEGVIKGADLPIVIDADGINSICKNLSILNEKRDDIVLTPHPGEMSNLLGVPAKEIQKNRIEYALSFAVKYKVFLVLKGAATIVATPYGRVFINSTGNEGMATGGMGDVLTGMIAGFITQGYDITDAVVTGVYMHGAVADTIYRDKPFGYLATDIIEGIPGEIGNIING